MVEDNQGQWNGKWTGKQFLVIFCLMMVLSLSFYSLGLYIGKNSTVSSTTISSASTSNEAKRVEKSDKGSKSAASAQQQLPPPGDRYSVQIATAQTQEEAEEFLKKLQKSGFDSAHIVASESGSNTQFYVIRVGPYKLEIARQVAEELQKEHGFKDAQILTKEVE
ncbi:MAG: SPOR domain-containing protein [Blastocatellia bacterium]|nr:SPOR domain-containing protein [Blastocatellia bacterium]